eukprot:COSAG01_NODE_2301_length_7953_cov_4.000127_4_plen_229_part_00
MTLRPRGVALLRQRQIPAPESHISFSGPALQNAGKSQSFQSPDHESHYSADRLSKTQVNISHSRVPTMGIMLQRWYLLRICAGPAPSPFAFGRWRDGVQRQHRHRRGDRSLFMIRTRAVAEIPLRFCSTPETLMAPQTSRPHLLVCRVRRHAEHRVRVDGMGARRTTLPMATASQRPRRDGVSVSQRWPIRRESASACCEMPGCCMPPRGGCPRSDMTAVPKTRGPVH